VPEEDHGTTTGTGAVRFAQVTGSVPVSGPVPSEHAATEAAHSGTHSERTRDIGTSSVPTKDWYGAVKEASRVGGPSHRETGGELS